MDKRVCVLIVTYNRKEYLKNLIENGLMKQTHLIDEIIIFDNCSSDGTAEILLKSNIIKTAMPEEICENSYNGVRILYYLNKTNDGGSGGFYGGIKIALGEGCDYVWVMDDDVVPDPNCLKILLKSISETNKVVIPCRTDDFFSDSAIVDVNMSNPFLFSVRARKTKVDSKDIKGDSIIVKDMPFEGPLFDVSVIKKIGLPRKELFIFF